MRYYTEYNIWGMTGLALGLFLCIIGSCLLYKNESNFGIGIIAVGIGILAMFHSIATESKIDHVIKVLRKNNQFDYEMIKKKTLVKPPKESKKDLILAVLLIIMVIVSIPLAFIVIDEKMSKDDVIKKFEKRYSSPLEAYNAYHNGTLIEDEIPKELFPIIKNFKP